MPDKHVVLSTDGTSIEVTELAKSTKYQCNPWQGGDEGLTPPCTTLVRRWSLTEAQYKPEPSGSITKGGGAWLSSIICSLPCWGQWC